MLTRMKAVLALSLVFSLSLGGAALAQEEAEVYPLPGNEVFPEGIALDAATGDFFVGSTTDGTIFSSNVSQPGVEASVFSEGGADGRTAAIGMKTNGAGRLFVAGGDTGQMFVYDAVTGALIESFDNGQEMTFVNDVTLTPDGSAFFTDSMNPELYRVFPDGAGGYEMETYLSFEGTPVRYEEGFNLNGIQSSEDGRYLVTVKSATGELFRIDTTTQEVSLIETGGADLTNGDGILLDGQTLYVVRNQQELIVPVELSADFFSGTPGEPFTDESFMYPTTIARSDSDLFAVNSQFDARQTGNPQLPFNVSSVHIPKEATGASDDMPQTGGPNPMLLLGGSVAAVVVVLGALALVLRSVLQRQGRNG
jgi:Cu-Zn family superoxide dismutase